MVNATEASDGEDYAAAEEDIGDMTIYMAWVATGGAPPRRLCMLHSHRANMMYSYRGPMHAAWSFRAPFFTSLRVSKPGYSHMVSRG